MLLTSGDQTSKVLLKSGTTATLGTSNPKDFTVSVKGCKEVDARIEMTGGTKANIQSFAEVKIKSHECTDKNMTNKEGGLLDEQGEPLPVPATPTPE